MTKRASIGIAIGVTISFLFSSPVFAAAPATANRSLTVARQRAKMWDNTAQLVRVQGEGIQEDGSAKFWWQYSFHSAEKHSVLSVAVSTNSVSEDIRAELNFSPGKAIGRKPMVDSDKIIRQSIPIARQAKLNHCRWTLYLKRPDGSPNDRVSWIAFGKCEPKDVWIYFDPFSGNLLKSEIFSHPAD